jgi:hypothetical protein
MYPLGTKLGRDLDLAPYQQGLSPNAAIICLTPKNCKLKPAPISQSTID